MFGAALVRSPSASPTVCPANSARPLLPDDGRLAAGLLSLPASTVSPVRSKGTPSPHTLYLAPTNRHQEPKLWYGIGILYDRYGSLEHAEEAFSQVMRMEPNFEKANEIYFRLGIIYKQQQKFNQSLDVSRGRVVRGCIVVGRVV